jgi:hypothetical protein
MAADRRSGGFACPFGELRMSFYVLRMSFDVLRMSFDVLRVSFDVLRVSFDVLRRSGRAGAPFVVRRLTVRLVRSESA